MSLILSGTDGLSDVDGSAATPAIRGTDANTGIFFPAADTIAFSEGGAEVARFDSSGNLGIGTASPGANLQVGGVIRAATANDKGVIGLGEALSTNPAVNCGLWRGDANDAVSSTTGLVTTGGNFLNIGGYAGLVFTTGAANIGAQTERMRIDASGRVLVGTTSTNLCAGDTVGIGLNTTINGTYAVGAAQFSAIGTPALNVNRKTDDGSLVTFSQAGTSEGTISVAGTTVSYNGGHLSRWAQTTAPKDDTLVKGTVLSNLDAMNVYTDADGNPVANEQLNKVKVSDAEGDVNVAGVFVNWTHDDAHDVDEINMAMTGDMIIRIAQGVIVQRGDLLMSAGDGTAKAQGDDIVRSKTIAKVTSTHVTCTYVDGSYCVPCVLMAC